MDLINLQSNLVIYTFICLLMTDYQNGLIAVSSNISGPQ